MTSFPGLTVDEVSLVDENSDLFTVEFLNKGDILPNNKEVKAQSGVMVLKAAGGLELTAGSKYKLSISSRLSNGLEIVKTVTVRPAK
jgi:hypothetical protein